MLNFLHRGCGRDNEGGRGFLRFPLQGGPWKGQVSVRTSDGSCPRHGPSMRSLCHLAAPLWELSFHRLLNPEIKAPTGPDCTHPLVWGLVLTELCSLQPTGSEGLLSSPWPTLLSHIWATAGYWGSPPSPSLWTWEGGYLPSNCRPAPVWLNQRTLLAGHWTTLLISHEPLLSLSFCGYSPSGFFLILYCSYSSFIANSFCVKLSLPNLPVGVAVIGCLNSKLMSIIYQLCNLEQIT